MKGQTEGARLVAGGGRPTGLDRGYYVKPTVVADVDNNMVIAREEIFGPVLCVIPAVDEADAIRIANDSVYGLNASVFTADDRRAVKSHLRCGREPRVRTTGAPISASPLADTKRSGIGREGGIDGLRLYLETKTVILDNRPT